MTRRAAILIDGAYFLKRLPHVRKDVVHNDVDSVVTSIRQLVYNHLSRLSDEQFKDKSDNKENPYNLLHRCLYYDARPYDKREQKIISKKNIDYSKSEQAVFRRNLFTALMKERNFALRLGKVQRKRGWVLTDDVQEQILEGKKLPDDLVDEDFVMGFQQKGVDMRLGVDIAHMALKKQVNTIILVAGDADFVPASKLARREGVRVILDSLRGSVADDLFEHIDEFYSGFPKPARRV